jgi:hypothetical protein
MSEPLGDSRKPLDNLLQSTVEEHNQQADELLGVFQRDFPRTYRLLDGSHFQLPTRREADYLHYRYAVYDNARTFISATTELAGRSGLDVDAWCRVRGECQVLNEWMKRGTTTLFVERELGEPLKRTDLPEGFDPQDLRWRWTALRLILPTGLFRLKDAQGEWDVFCVTLVKVVDGQQLDLHPTLQEEATIMFGHRPLSDVWPGQDAMLFYFQRRPHPKHKKSLGTYGACQLDERSLRTLAEEIDVHADSRPFWTPDLSAFVIGFKRFLFNVLLYMGSFPEEYEPEKVLRPAREKKGRFRPELREARFLGKEAYRPARRPTEAEHEPTGRQLPGHWRAGHWRRQAFGEGSLQRKLIWIQPYRTAGLDA